MENVFIEAKLGLKKSLLTLDLHILLTEEMKILTLNRSRTGWLAVCWRDSYTSWMNL